MCIIEFMFLQERASGRSWPKRLIRLFADLDCQNGLDYSYIFCLRSVQLPFSVLRLMLGLRVTMPLMILIWLFLYCCAVIDSFFFDFYQGWAEWTGVLAMFPMVKLILVFVLQLSILWGSSSSSLSLNSIIFSITFYTIFQLLQTCFHRSFESC